MDGSEIDSVRALLNSKPRPVGWAQRRERHEEVGSIWPVADDVNLDLVDLDGVPGEWSIAHHAVTPLVSCCSSTAAVFAPDPSSARRMVTEAGRAAGTRTLAVAIAAADADPSGSGRDAARGRHTLRRRSRSRRCARDVGDLATHDSRVVPVERASGTRPPGAGQRRIIHPRMPLKEGRS
jgi:monoterpene epsilon-lactone hydrolase